MTAVESVVHGGAPDVAVVVSDNSTDRRESERLREFCARQPGSVEYVRPPEPLAMAAHWEWLWHVIEERVAPSHVAYLTDRLAFSEGALPALLDAVWGNPEHVISYHWDYVNDVATPVELVQSQWTGQLLELDTAKLIELSSRGVFGQYIPRLMTSVAPVGVVSRIRQRFGDVFGTVSPDFRFAYRCLAVCDTLLYLDRPCVIEYGMAWSNGSNVRLGTRSADAEDFARSVSGVRFAATPEPALETVANAIFQEYCTVRAEVGGHGFPPADWRSYLHANAISVDRIEEPERRARLAAILRRRGWTRRSNASRVAVHAAQITGYFLRHPSALARSVKRQLWDRPPGAPAARLLARLGLSLPAREDLRFESSAEAIAYANAHPRPRMSCAWHVHQLERSGAVLRRGGAQPAVRDSDAASSLRA